MLPGPDALADWFSPLASAIGAEELSALISIQAAAGARALESRLGAASSMHGAGEWLRSTAVSAAGQELAGEMIAATIAADHYQARLVCPQNYGRRLRRPAWQTYAVRRAAQALERFPDALLRWSVLERIPANWIVKEAVFAQMSARFEQQGYGGVAIEGDMASPFPAGAEWVSGECAPECDALRSGGAGALRGAVLFWPGRVVPAIVAREGGECNAYAPELDRRGIRLELQGNGATPGVLLLPSPENPPASGPMAFWRFLRLDSLAWGAIRRWRVWRRSRR